MEDKSGLGRNAISLPQGGGAAVGEGDAFQVDQLRGTGSYSIPISIPKARGRLALSLNLTYSSDVGFGPIGLGWDLNVASIRRRLDTGVPTYNDDDDVFTFDGEELLKVGPNHYRCRIEKNYWRIERVGNGWKVHDRSGNLYVLGESANSQVFNPANQVEVQAWMLDRLEDPNGNVIQYSYRRDAQTISLAPQLSFQAARLYLDKIEYNPHESGWLNRIQLVYDYDGPTESPRSDAYLSYRAGFPIYTAWRLSRIEVHADIPGEFNGRVRSYALDYQADPDCGLALLSAIQITGFNVDGTSEDLPPITFNYSQLDVSAAEVERLEGAPPIDLAAGNTELVDLTGNGLPDILNTLSGAHTFWLNNSWRQSENLGPGERHFAPGTAMAASPDITLSQPAAHLADVRGRVATDLLSDTIILDSPSYAVTRDDILARNLSWGAATRFAVPPPFNFQDGRARVVDLTGRGRMDVLRAEQGFRHWLNRPDGTYEDRGMSPQIPGLSFLSSEWTFADLNGDGLADIVRVRNGRIEYYLNRGAGHRSDDLFEPVPIVMDNGIALRQGQTEWDPERLIFVDLNGDGFDDAVYLHSDRSIYWINQGGRAWSDAHEVPLTENGAPINLTTNRASVRVGDILGSGTPGVLWSGDGLPMRYCDFADGIKPLLLTVIDNGIGGRTTIDYCPTTQANGSSEWNTRIPFTLHVVKRVTHVDTTTGSIETTEYTYLDGSFDRERREFIGFGEVRIVETGDDNISNPTCQTRVTTIHYHVEPSSSTDPLTRARARALAGHPYRKTISGSDTSQPHSTVERLYDTDISVDFDDQNQHVYGTNGLSQKDGSGSPIPEPAALALNTHELVLIYDPGGPPINNDRTKSLGGRLSIQNYRDDSNRIDPFGRVLSSITAEGVSVLSSPPVGEEVLITINGTTDKLQLSASVNAACVTASPNVIKRRELQYAENPGLHMVLPVARSITRSSGNIIEDTRNYFDGPEYVGLPLGDVQFGNITREEVLSIRDDQVNDVYSGMPGGPPDFAALGYHRAEYGTPRSRYGSLSCNCSRQLPKGSGVRWWHRYWGLFKSRIQRFICIVLCRPEGYGYFINRNRYRYAVLSNGDPAYGLFDRHKNGNGQETSYQYDLFYLNVVEQTDPAGNTSFGEADYRVSKMARVTDANGHTEMNRYDALGRIASVIKPGDSSTYPTTVWEYPSPNSPLPTFVKTRMRESAGNSATFDSIEYRNGWNQPIQTRVESRNGQFIVSGAVSYNRRGGLRERFIPFFASSSAYAPPPSDSKRFQFFVDLLDRDVLIRHPDGSEVRRHFMGFASEESDREDLRVASAHYGTPTRFVRDARNNLIEVHQRLAGSNVVAAYDYDVLNNIVGIRLSGGVGGTPYCRYYYDLLGHRLRTDQADSNPTYAVFNAGGQVALKVDARNQTTELVYDGAGRIKERRFPTSGEPSVRYEYCDSGDGCDPNRNVIGRLAQVTDALGTVQFDYNSRGRTTRHERTWNEFGVSKTYAVELEYDSADRLRGRTYPQISTGLAPLTIEWRYDTGNRLEGVDLITDGASNALITNISYDPRGQRHLIEFGNGLLTELTYDSERLNLSRITTSNQVGNVLQDIAYCHDREGNVMVRFNRLSASADLYLYDALYRLVEARRIDTSTWGSVAEDCEALYSQLVSAPGSEENYEYSPEGDLQVFGSAGTVQYFPRNGHPRGQVTLGGKIYVFDDAGALEYVKDGNDPSITRAHCQYNSDGRLTKVELSSEDLSIEFYYDYEGERVGKRVTRISDQTLASEIRWLGRWVSFHRDSNVNHWERVRQYVFDESKPWVIFDGAGEILSYVHADHLGSSDFISNKDGNAICTLSYDSFGNDLTPNSCIELRHRYNGKETDREIALVNYGARHYLPETGRWISPDPVLWTEPENHLLNPQALNAYSYAANNPVTLIDPVGKSPGKYAGQYIDTGITITRQVLVDGVPHIGYYKVIETIPGTWLSKVTYDYGWERSYSKEEGYGAYDRAIIFPLSNDLYTKGVNYDPDKIGTRERFGVLLAPIQPVTFTEGMTIDVPKPQPAAEQGRSWMPDAITISLSGAFFTPWIVGGGSGIEAVYIFGKGWVIYWQFGGGGGMPGPSGALEVGPIWQLKDPKDYAKHMIEVQAAAPLGPVPASLSLFGWPGGSTGFKAGVGSPGAGAMYEYSWILQDFTDKKD